MTFRNTGTSLNGKYVNAVLGLEFTPSGPDGNLLLDPMIKTLWHTSFSQYLQGHQHGVCGRGQ